MHYLGGKFRVAKDIAIIVESYRQEDQPYLEPFVGAGWVLQEVVGQRMASDINPYLIELYKALQRGWIPPSQVSESEYHEAKVGDFCPPYLRAFIGFGCSWGGKWFGGYARDPKSDRNYALNAQRSLLKALPRIQDVSFHIREYTDWSPQELMIYCDPPYENTTAYSAAPNFNYPKFWAMMRSWSNRNTVLISSYYAPPDFETVWSKETKTDLGNSKGEKIPRLERLFKYHG
jgi:DNA adenine methylase